MRLLDHWWENDTRHKRSVLIKPRSMDSYTKIRKHEHKREQMTTTTDDFHCTSISALSVWMLPCQMPAIDGLSGRFTDDVGVCTLAMRCQHKFNAIHRHSTSRQWQNAQLPTNYELIFFRVNMWVSLYMYGGVSTALCWLCRNECVWMNVHADVGSSGIV